jgi:DNA-3-methyladenine glycosylase II
LRKLGYSRRNSEVLVGLARRVVEGDVDLDDLVQADDATAISRLCELDGIGRWSAEYVLLRGLGRLHVFPETTSAPATSWPVGSA